MRHWHRAVKQETGYALYAGQREIFCKLSKEHAFKLRDVFNIISDRRGAKFEYRHDIDELNEFAKNHSVDECVAYMRGDT